MHKIAILLSLILVFGIYGCSSRSSTDVFVYNEVALEINVGDKVFKMGEFIDGNPLYSVHGEIRENGELMVIGSESCKIREGVALGVVSISSNQLTIKILDGNSVVFNRLQLTNR